MKHVFGASLIALGVLSTASETRASTLYVANNGVDSATCGARIDPCRSIGQAITHASAGDTIIVGPGLYGDLTGDGEFAAPGEEVGGRILVDKALTIESSHGAEATTLGFVPVEIATDGAVFGGAGKGFTFYVGDLPAAVIVSPGTTGNTVSGNAADQVFDIDGTNHVVTRNQARAPTPNGGFGGFLVRGTGHSLSSNLVIGAPFFLDHGFLISGTEHSITNNTIVGATVGVSLDASASAVIIRRNTILGNSQRGIFLSAGSGATITENNVYGNGVNSSNCGIWNESGTTIDATHNFWGLATGPGPDPADDVCDETGSMTLVSPVASQQFAIAPRSSGGDDDGNKDKKGEKDKKRR